MADRIPCDNELCLRKPSSSAKNFLAQCLHELCVKCVVDVYKENDPLCPVEGCGICLLGENGDLECGGGCGKRMDPMRVFTMMYCDKRKCIACLCTKGCTIEEGCKQAE